MIIFNQNPLFRSLHLFRITLLLVVLSLHGVPASAQHPHHIVDLMLTCDQNLNAGIRFFRWQPVGMFYGLKFSLVGPEGERVIWNAVTAERLLRDQFRGYSQEKFTGLHAGFALFQDDPGIILYGGVGIVRGRRFRVYSDPERKEGYEVYHMLDKMQKRYLVDIVFGVFKRGNGVNYGMGFSSATRGLEILFGFPLDRFDLWG